MRIKSLKLNATGYEFDDTVSSHFSNSVKLNDERIPAKRVSKSKVLKFQPQERLNIHISNNISVTHNGEILQNLGRDQAGNIGSRG